jgi:hypothetical protein
MPRMLQLAVDELHQTLVRAHQILERDYESLAPYWENLAREAAAMSDPTPDEVLELCGSVWATIGVGMGSLQDIFVSDDFEVALDEVGTAASRAGWMARELGTGPLRRYVTALESALLEADRPGEAAGLRTLLERDDMELSTIRGALDRLAVAHIASGPVRSALKELEREIRRRAARRDDD